MIRPTQINYINNITLKKITFKIDHVLWEALNIPHCTLAALTFVKEGVYIPDAKFDYAFKILTSCKVLTCYILIGFPSAMLGLII